MKTYLSKAAVLAAATILAACGGGQSSPSTPGSSDQPSPDTSNPNNGPANPVAVTDTATVPQDSMANAIDVLANDQPDGSVTVNLQSFDANSANGGTITRDDNGTANDLSDDELLFTPLAGSTASDSFSYVINNSDGATDTTTVQISITPTPNMAPVANDDEFAVAGGSSNASLLVLTNDSDADNDPVFLDTFPSVSTQSGTLSRNDNDTPDDQSDDTIFYTPAEGFSGEDSFEYGISDGNGGSDTAQVTITVGAGEPAGADRGTGCRDKDVRLNSGIGYCFDAEFNTAHDGTKIDMTVYVPHPDRLAELTTGSLAEGELGFVPLVIHSHGFGGSKNDDFEVDPGHFVDNQTGRDAWQRGYFVISFSERGFGQSGGMIGFMDPTKEGQDQNELLDWAIKHLRGPSAVDGTDGIYDFTFDVNNAEHISSQPVATADTRPSLLMNDVQTRLQPNAEATADVADPSVGTLGYSYGGGYQYTFSHADTDDITDRVEKERLDALIPEGTWHDLRYSLHSNDTPKGYWATLLFTFATQGGTLSNGQALPPLLAEVYAQAITPPNRVSAKNQNLLGANSTSEYCDQDMGVTTRADLLHIQGVRDTLFDFNDGYSNAKCFADAGNDVRYLAVSGGHPLTIGQQPIYTGQTTSMDIDEVIHCGIDTATGKPKRLIVKDLMYAWFEEKLRGQAGKADIIPKVCINQENTDPTDFLVDDDYNQTNNSFNYLKEGLVLDSIDDIKIGALSNNELNQNIPASYTCDQGDSEKCPIDVIVSLASINGTEVQAGSQVFVPLYTESADNTDLETGTSRVLAGIPTAKLTLEYGGSLGGQFLAAMPQSTETPFQVFVGVGLKRGAADPVILHDQITPIRQTFAFPWTATINTFSSVTEIVPSTSGGLPTAVGAGDIETDVQPVQTENGNPIHYGCGYDYDELTVCDRGQLAGVTTRLLPGDQIGLIFTPSDVQYQQMVNLPGALKITGDVEFPIYPVSALPASNNPPPAP